MARARERANFANVIQARFTYHAPHNEAARGDALMGIRTTARSILRLALGVAFAAAFSGPTIAQKTSGAGDWSSSNFDQSANRYSPLTQITTKNVATMQQVWSF